MLETLKKYWIRYDPETDEDLNFLRTVKVETFLLMGMSEVKITNKYIDVRRSDAELARSLLRARDLKITPKQ